MEAGGAGYNRHAARTRTVLPRPRQPAMSWSLTINNLTEQTELPPEEVEMMLTQHILYGQDMAVALKAAKRAGFKSCTLTGGRTPSPLPGGDEVVDISIRGFVKATDYREEVKRILFTGPGNDKQADG